MSSTPPSSQARAEEVFLAVADLPADRQRAEAERLCAGDARVLDEVLSLLGFHGQAESFLDNAEIVKLSGDPIWTGDEELPAGAQLGVYTIVRPIGSGGMGRVYVAQQDRPRRTVALKVIRRGLFTESLVRRFEQEAEVLGRLHHPGIAQIYEAGAAEVVLRDGQSDRIKQPYFALELVDGLTLTDHVRERNLSTDERMLLIARVCDAVQHAHQKGVIHRDLKPANILVDEHGQPKVLDFGVARATDANNRFTTLHTGVGQLIGTLPYMSPEQVVGDPGEIDTRCDVYALGVLLYQVLTGKLPLDLSSRSIPEAARVIREESPRPLSTIHRHLRGEVQIIVSKALEKDKARRYQSAADLAADLRRHVAGEPIAARQDSAFYVLSKQIRRHRWPFAVATSGVVALAAFAGYASWQARIQSDLAASERDARRLADDRAGALARALYASRINYAQAAIDAGEVNTARAELDLCPPEARAWEWRHLWARSDDSIRAFPMNDAIGFARIAPDGLTAYYQEPWERVRRVRLDDPASGASFEHTHRSSGLSLSPTGSRFLTFRLNGTLVLTDAITGTLVRETPMPSPPDSQRFTSAVRVVMLLDDSHAAVLRSDQRLAVVRVETGELLWMTPASSSDFLVISELQAAPTPDEPGRRVFASGSRDGTVTVWNLDDAGPVAQTRFPGVSPVAIALSPDASTIAIGGFRGEVGAWRWASQEPPVVRREAHGARADAVTFAADSSRAFSGSYDRVLRAWTLPDLAPAWEQRGSGGPISYVARTSNPREVVTAGHDRAFRFWSVDPAPHVPVRLVVRDIIFGLHEALDGSAILCTRNGEIWKADPRAERPRRIGTNYGCRDGFQAFDGSLIGAGDDGKVTRFAIGDMALSPPQTLELAAQGAVAAALSPDRRTLAVAGRSSPSIFLIDPSGWRVLAEATMPDGAEKIAAVEFLADAELAVIDEGGMIRGFHADGSPSVLALPSDPKPSCLAVGRGGRMIASGGAEGGIRLWVRNPASNAWDSRPLSTPAERVNALDFLPDGSRLAAAFPDRTVRLYDTSTGEVVCTLHGPASYITRLASRSDGVGLMAADQQGNLILWEAPPGTPGP